MSTIAYVVLLSGALACSFVSGLAGFGTALMALGIWLYVLPPPVAVPLVVICSILRKPRRCIRSGDRSTSGWSGHSSSAVLPACRWGPCWSIMPIRAYSD